MLRRGEHVILGVSGGADSMCLLFVLHGLAPEYSLTLTAVHVNHGLRGAEADEDEACVREICAGSGIDCVCFRTDIHALARKEKLTEEEAGRKFRYACFEKVRCARNADKIAVAHHMNDQAETVLFNLFRGSRLTGLGGISPVRGDIIRPLLCVERTEIEAFLKAEHIAFRTDRTNFDTAYTRNKIRLLMLPVICESINSQAVAHIADAAAAAREAGAFIRRQAAAAYEKVRDASGGLVCERLAREDKVIQKEILRLWFQDKTGRLKDVTGEHVESMLGLLEKPDGKQVSLPYGVTVVRKKQQLCFKPERDAAEKSGDASEKNKPAENGHITGKAAGEEDEKNAAGKAENEEVGICTVPGHYAPGGGTMAFSFDIAEYEENQIIPENNCTKWFDYDKIVNGLILRHRRTGDYMTIAPGGVKKQLRRVMIDDKIPKDMRGQLWLLADGAHILWMPGGRISEHYKVTKDTKKILIVRIKGEKTWQKKSVCC